MRSALVLLMAGGFAFPQAAFEGRSISSITFDPQAQPLPQSELDRLLPIKAGQSLSMDGVRAALQKLYLTGRYTDITVDAEPDGVAVTLRFVTTPSFFIGGVSIEGEDEPPNRNQLVAATKLELGAPFLGTEVETAVTNMQDRLRANGFYSSQVQYRIDRNPETEEATIHFDINTGDRARFGGVRLAGQFVESPEKVIHTTRWRNGFGPLQFPGWRQVTESRVQSGIDRLRDYFQKGDHLEARVTLNMLDHERDTNRVTPNLTVNGGPVIHVGVSGAKVSGGRLRQLVPVYQERSIDQALLIEGRRNILEYVQGMGYFEAQVDFDQPQAGSGRTEIDYTVMLGPRHRLREIEIAGNHFFDTATLRERMYVVPASWLRRRWGRFSQTLLEQDKEAIRELYRASGFREADVISAVTEPQPEHLKVKLDIVEGTQWFVNSLTLEGPPEQDRDKLQSMLQSTAGQPFSESSIASDRETILSYFYNNGYPDATFDWAQTPAGDEPKHVDLKYTVQPGKREFVRSVLIRGLETTNPKLISSRVSIAPGDPVSQSRMGDSQQKLYDLGIFSRVQTALQNPDGDEDSKYVLVHVDEARKYSFNAGFGAELARIGGGVTTFDAPAGTTGFSPRISLGLSRINFLGLGHTVGVQTLASTLEQRALVTYLAPQFTGNENLALTFSALFDDSRDIRTFLSHRWEGSVQLAQKLPSARTVQYRFTIRRVTIADLKISSVELIPLLSQPDRTGVLGFSFIQDHRDDPTDSHHGSLNTVDLGVAWKWFGSETDYTRILARNSTYHRIGKDLVLARSLQFGYIQRLGGLAEIPLAERFFSGGASSHRAFPDNQAGPRDVGSVSPTGEVILPTGFPLGGNALLFHNTELRFPLIGDNVGGVLFHDMGNVYSDIDHVSFRFRQKNLQDFDYMVHSVGFGIRYRTPVGPIRVDFSLSPNSPRFFGFSGTRDQLLAGQGVLTNQRINVFQFHFSLGQTF